MLCSLCLMRANFLAAPTFVIAVFLSGNFTVRNSSFKSALAAVEVDGFLHDNVVTVGGSPSTGNVIANVGYPIDTGGVPHAFVRDKHGTIIEFEAPGACQAPGQGTQTSSFYGLNNAGWFAGPFSDCSIIWHGYLRAPDGRVTTIDAPGAGTGAGQGTIADSVGDNTAITGWHIHENNVNHGFVRGHHGRFTTINAPGAGTGAGQGTLVADITLAGDIAGFYVDSNNVAHGYSRDADGAFVTFEASGAGRGAGQGTYAIGSNAEGVITGYYVDSNNVAHGFLRN